MLDIIPLRYFRSAIITMMFLIYIVIMMCVMESLHYLDRNNINPYRSLWKKILWIIVLPWHNNARDLIVKLKLRPRIRQPYYIGSIEKNPTLKKQTYSSIPVSAKGLSLESASSGLG